MDKPVLGRLEQVDLRGAWNNESTDFTPWLAEQENLELLGKAIGLELELEARDVNANIIEDHPLPGKVSHFPKQSAMLERNIEIELYQRPENQQLVLTG